MLQRIEILTDGASALYGSDAVAGVVNFITRNDFEGAELNIKSQWLEDGGSTPEFNLAGIFGAQGENTGIVAGFEYASTEQINSDDRYDTARLKDGFIQPSAIRVTFSPRAREVPRVGGQSLTRSAATRRLLSVLAALNTGLFKVYAEWRWRTGVVSCRTSSGSTDWQS